MAKYFNTSKGTLAVVLRSGDSASLPGKQWTNIPSHEEGSEDLINAVKKGFLVRSTVDDEVEPAVSKEKAAAPASKAEVAETVSTVSAEVEAPVPEELATSKESVPEKTSESRRRKV